MSEAVVWDAIIPADNAPWHQNSYIHPSSSPEKPDKKQKKSRKSKKQTGKPYPAGTRPGIVKISNQKPKYQITDVSGKIAGVDNATLTLHWNVQPWVGALVWDNRKTFGRWEGLKGGEAKFDFPPLKGTETKKGDLETATGAEARRGKPS